MQNNYLSKFRDFFKQDIEIKIFLIGAWILSLLSFIFNFINPKLVENSPILSSSPFFVFLFCTTSLVVMMSKLEVNKKIADMNHYIDDKLSQNHDFCETISTCIQKMSDEMKYVNNATIIKIENEVAFYELLTRSRDLAKKEILVTHLDPSAPQSYSSERERYFYTTLDFIRERDDVIFRRITGLKNEEKLDWAIKLIEDTKDCNNFQMAFIKEQDNCLVPPITSVQIFDDEEMYLINPNICYPPSADDWSDCLYIKNKDIVSIYKNYYMSIFRSLRNDKKMEYGCILKDRNNIYTDNYAKIRATFDAKP